MTTEVYYSHRAGDGVFGKKSNMKIGNLQKDSETIGWRWVFHKKDNEQYKVRLGAKGYAHKEGIDYNEIFSPIVKHTSIQMLLAIVVQFDLKLEQMDVKTVFLHGELEEKIEWNNLKVIFRKVKKTRCVF